MIRKFDKINDDEIVYTWVHFVRVEVSNDKGFAITITLFDSAGEWGLMIDSEGNAVVNRDASYIFIVRDVNRVEKYFSSITTFEVGTTDYVVPKALKAYPKLYTEDPRFIQPHIKWSKLEKHDVGFLARSQTRGAKIQLESTAAVLGNREAHIARYVRPGATWCATIYEDGMPRDSLTSEDLEQAKIWAEGRLRDS
jgi:hypothetical protein